MVTTAALVVLVIPVMGKKLAAQWSPPQGSRHYSRSILVLSFGLACEAESGLDEAGK